MWWVPFPANVVAVLVASPGDVADERDAIRAALWDFNDLHAQALQVILLPVLWETHSRADLGAHPQELLDQQIVDGADVVVGVFWTRIGSLLPDGTPATVHELERVVAAGKPALLYFSNQPAVPASIDPQQMKGVTEFKRRARDWGIYREYDNVSILIDRLKSDLLRTVRDRLALPTPEAPIDPKAAAAAHPVASIVTRESTRVDSKGRLKINRPSYLVIRNVGTATAEDLTLEWVEPTSRPDDWRPPHVRGLDESIEFLPHGGEVELPMLTSWGGPSGGVLRMTWRNADGTSDEARQTIK
jgi:hypothetical protein